MRFPALYNISATYFRREAFLARQAAARRPKLPQAGSAAPPFYFSGGRLDTMYRLVKGKFG